MPQKVAFIMDPLEGVKAYKDTSYYMMLATVQLGHEVYYLDQRDLSVLNSQLYGIVRKVTVHTNIDHPFDVDPPQKILMSEMDVVMIRTDPPFDRRYFYTTLLLDRLPPTTRVCNRPQGIRDWNEKLASLEYPDLTPKTLISNNGDEIREFLATQERITIKPVDGHGGRGIVFLRPDSDNIDQLIDMSTHGDSQWVVAQAFVPEAKKGDKRIILLNGEPLGGILRVAAEGKELNNMDAGGTPVPTELTDRELEVCARLKDDLIKRGIIFCGIDMLGDYLIEINVTSPTGLQELCRFQGKDFHHQIMDTIIRG